jgi:hypothetical protein
MMTRRFFGGFAPFESFQDPTMQATSFGQNITGAEQQVKIKTQAARPSNIRSGMKQASNRS